MTQKYGIFQLIAILAGGMLTGISPAAEVTELAFLPGTIWDVDDERILWSNAEGIWIDRVLERESELVIARRGGVDVDRAHLTPQGFLYLDDGMGLTLFEYSPIGVTNLGRVASASSLRVAGHHVIFSRSGGGQPLVHYDTLTREEVLVSPEAGNNGNDVSADGVVVYWTGIGFDGNDETPDDYNIVRWQGGESTRLTDDTFFWNVYPRTDGNLVVYSGKLMGGLTVNIPGGWEFDGEFIAFGDMSGSPVTFDEATVRVRGSDFRLFGAVFEPDREDRAVGQHSF